MTDAVRSANIQKQPHNFMLKTPHAVEIVKELNRIAKVSRCGRSAFVDDVLCVCVLPFTASGQNGHT
jgi:hypothetical protein